MASLAHQIRPAISRCTPRGRRSITTNATDAASKLLETFAGKDVTRKQLFEPNQLQRLSLTLNRKQLHPGIDVSAEPPKQGTPLPPGYHLVYFTPTGVESELGMDGTDKTFNAPAPFTRRMWAGGKMQFIEGTSLKVGEEVEERTRLVGATPKKSRSGDEMVLVDVEKEFWGRDGLVVKDQRYAFPALYATMLVSMTYEFLGHGFSDQKSMSPWLQRLLLRELTGNRLLGRQPSRMRMVQTAVSFGIFDGHLLASSGSRLLPSMAI